MSRCCVLEAWGKTGKKDRKEQEALIRLHLCSKVKYYHIYSSLKTKLCRELLKNKLVKFLLIPQRPHRVVLSGGKSLITNGKQGNE